MAYFKYCIGVLSIVCGSYVNNMCTANKYVVAKFTYSYKADISVFTFKF